jgi:phenylacetate-CoA ligase
LRDRQLSDGWGRDEARRLAETLSAAERLPAYRESLTATPDRLDPRERLRRLPVLERAQVQKAPDSFRDRSRRAIELHTSGSTGTPLTLYLDEGARRRRVVQFARFFFRSGWRPWHRSLSLKVLPDSSARLGSPWLDRTVLARRRTCSVLEPLEEQYARLRAIDPDILHGLPSVIHMLAARALADGWRPARLSRIFTASEALEPSVRKVIEHALGAPVIDSYASAEAFIAWQCERRSGYHVNARSVFLEIVGEDGQAVAPGEAGRVVITTLDNPAMPLLRYAIGDMAVRGDAGPCPCGRPGPIVPRVLGRRIDLFLPLGRPVSPWGLVARMHELEFVRQFQIVQTASDAVSVVLAPRDGAELDVPAIEALVADELGPGLRVEVREVARIDRLPNGKYAPATSLLVASDAVTDRTA